MGQDMGKDLFCRQSVIKCFSKTRKIKQNWTRSESFDICFCIGFDSYCKKLFIEWILGTNLCLKPILTFSSLLLIYQVIRQLMKQFVYRDKVLLY